MDTYTSISRHGEEFFPKVLPGSKLFLDFETFVDIIQVSGSHQMTISKSCQCFIGLSVSVLGHVPTWAFWHEVYHQTNEERWDRGGAKHEAPIPVWWWWVFSIVPDLLKRNGDNETEHDPKGRPHLPHHRECSSDSCWSTFGGVHRGRARFRTHCQAKCKASNEEIVPRICGGLPDTLITSASYIQR